MKMMKNEAKISGIESFRANTIFSNLEIAKMHFVGGLEVKMR